MSNIISAAEQIETLQREIEQLKHRSLLQLKVKLAEARHTVVILEKQIEDLTGKAAAVESPVARKPRATASIADIVKAIKGGATNYRAIAAVVGASAAYVTKKVKEEGKAAGITSSGQKAKFKLQVK